MDDSAITTMNNIELARMIAINSRDIPDMINTLCDEAMSLADRLENITDPQEQYHQDAMRTAAGPEVFHRPMIADVRLSDAQFFNGTASVMDALADHIHSSRVLSALKATLFYGKEWKAPHRSDVDVLFNGFHHDQFDNYQLLHAILGIASEGGELLEDVVALVSLPDPGDCDENDLPKLEKERVEIAANMVREQGDIDWFQELFAHAIGKPVALSRELNIERLKARFPDKFSEEDALARAEDALARADEAPQQTVQYCTADGCHRNVAADGECGPNCRNRD